MNGMLLLYEQRISGYGSSRASTHILLRYAPQNIRYTQTFGEIARYARSRQSPVGLLLVRRMGRGQARCPPMPLALMKRFTTSPNNG